MIRFYKKYELEIKIFLIAVVIFIGIYDIFFKKEVENRDFHRFMGIVWLFVTLFLLLDNVTILLKKRKSDKKYNGNIIE